MLQPMHPSLSRGIIMAHVLNRDEAEGDESPGSSESCQDQEDEEYLENCAAGWDAESELGHSGTPLRLVGCETPATVASPHIPNPCTEARPL